MQLVVSKLKPRAKPCVISSDGLYRISSAHLGPHMTQRIQHLVKAAQFSLAKTLFHAHAHSKYLYDSDLLFLSFLITVRDMSESTLPAYRVQSYLQFEFVLLDTHKRRSLASTYEKETYHAQCELILAPSTVTTIHSFAQVFLNIVGSQYH